MTFHHDLTVRFQDLSAQILVSSEASPLQRRFPNPLPTLTIDLSATLSDAAIATRTSVNFLDNAQIASAHLAAESLECAVVLRTGEVVLYRTIHAPVSPRPEDEELISLQHIPDQSGFKFRPEFAILAAMGPVTALAISDIGFMAVAYAAGSLFVIDMRGPKVLLRHAPEARSSFLHRNQTVNTFTSLTWTVSGTSAGTPT